MAFAVAMNSLPEQMKINVHGINFAATRTTATLHLFGSCSVQEYNNWHWVRQYEQQWLEKE
ncbi:hypothetical protein NIES3585_38950 [Nodularia sp. NIES-3585]|nr:hypothetical protein NIES3585_38950 [Nodularia sp. NIES-3585]